MKPPLLALLILLVSAPQARSASKPVRKGFTVEFGIGVGALVISGLDRYGEEKRDFGFEPHALSLGAFLRKDLALVLRWKSTYHFTPNAVFEDAQQFLGTQTANLQWWLSDRLFVGGGPGVALFGFGFGGHDKDASWSVGGALDARVGYAFFVTTHHALSLSFEAVVGFFGSGVALGQTVNVGYQYY